MGELTNCPRCGKVFIRVGRNLCPECIEEEEKEFERVRRYIKDNPGASLEEVTEITGVEEKKVLKWIRDGRIDVHYPVAGQHLVCRRCGKAITIGNYCSECTKIMARELQSATQRFTNPGSNSRNFEKGKKSKGMYINQRDKED